MKRSLLLFLLVGALKLNAQFSLPTPGGVQSDLKYTQNYSTQQVFCLLDSIYYWKLDTATLVWNPLSKEINIIYDSNYDQVYGEWHEFINGVLKPFARDSFSYNANHRAVFHERWLWNGSGWDKCFIEINTYNGSNYITNNLQLIWSLNTWKNNSQTNYTYDVNNNCLSYAYQIWSNNAWVNNTQAFYTYNTNNALTYMLYQKWNVNLQVWENLFQTNYIVNGIGAPTVCYTDTWYNSQWDSSGRQNYFYSGNNDPIQVIHEAWTGSGWVNSDIQGMTWDANHFEESFVGRKYDLSTGALNQGDSAFQYFKTITGLQEIEKEGTIRIYPNPSSGTFKIETGNEKQKLQVLDLNGRALITKEINGATELDASSLSDGIYTLTLQNKLGLSIRKLVIEK